MPLETGNYISDLDSSNPTGGDPINKGDDHLRLIKHVLQTQFPGAGGGYSSPINAKESELNNTIGTVANIQQQINGLQNQIDNITDILPAPSGTTMVFYQQVAPLNWIQISDFPDHMIRIAQAGEGGTSGGTHNPFIMNGSDVPQHVHTVQSGGAHDHGFSPTYSYLTFTNSGAGGFPGFDGDGDVPIVSPFSTHNGHSHSMDNNNGPASWEPKHIFMILARKQ